MPAREVGIDGVILAYDRKSRILSHDLGFLPFSIVIIIVPVIVRTGEIGPQTPAVEGVTHISNIVGIVASVSAVIFHAVCVSRVPIHGRPYLDNVIASHIAP